MAITYMAYDINIPVTIILNSLPNNSTAISAVIDNSVNAYMAADIQVKVKTTTGTNSMGAVAVLLLRTADNGLTFDSSNTNAEVIGIFNANTDSTTFVFSLDTGTIGSLPYQWKLAIMNQSGATFDATAGNFSVAFTGKYNDTH